MTQPNPSQNLLAEIEAFLGKSGMSLTAFGEAATGNGALVPGLRRGMQPRFQTVNRIRAYLETGVPGRQAVSDILWLIEDFLETSGMTPGGFGDAAVGDSALVSDIRMGREPRAQTVARIQDFIRTRVPYTSPNRPQDAAATGSQS